MYLHPLAIYISEINDIVRGNGRLSIGMLAEGGGAVRQFLRGRSNTTKVRGKIVPKYGIYPLYGAYCSVLVWKLFWLTVHNGIQYVLWYRDA